MNSMASRYSQSSSRPRRSFTIQPISLAKLGISLSMKSTLPLDFLLKMKFSVNPRVCHTDAFKNVIDFQSNVCYDLKKIRNLQFPKIMPNSNQFPNLNKGTSVKTILQSIFSVIMLPASLRNLFRLSFENFSKIPICGLQLRVQRSCSGANSSWWSFSGTCIWRLFKADVGSGNRWDFIKNFDEMSAPEWAFCRFRRECK